VTAGTNARSLVERCTETWSRLATMARPQDSYWLELDLSMGQLKAIVALTTQGPQSIGKLGRMLNVGEPAASTLVDKLVARGLVAREMDVLDRRRTLVVPTDEGRELVAHLQTLQKERLAEWLGRLETDDLCALQRGLEALVAAAQFTAGADSPAPTRGE
jgi:DNA-binding MarR family transcriptional regulator